MASDISRLLAESRGMQVVEILFVFAVAALIIAIGAPVAGENPLARQGVVWVANLCMLGTIWAGLRLRGQTWQQIGLRFGAIDRRALWGAVWRSLVVLVAALVAFGVGSIVMVNIVGRPEPADLTEFNYLSGNLPLFVLSLLGVFVVSSLGEEIIYRGFLITRLAELGGGGRTAWRLGVVVSSVVFGLAHIEWGPMGVVQTGFMGLALGVSYLVVRRNLWPLVLAHLYMDTILLAQMYAAP